MYKLANGTLLALTISNTGKSNTKREIRYEWKLFAALPQNATCLDSCDHSDFAVYCIVCRVTNAWEALRRWWQQTYRSFLTVLRVCRIIHARSELRAHAQNWQLTAMCAGVAVLGLRLLEEKNHDRTKIQLNF